MSRCEKCVRLSRIMVWVAKRSGIVMRHRGVYCCGESSAPTAIQAIEKEYDRVKKESKNARNSSN